MKPTRRTFLRVLGSAIVGAAVVPALPTFSAFSTSPTSLLTYEGLERAYHAALDSGEPEPSMGVARRQTLARETGLLYDVELAA